ncbi:MAG: energy transducer TonB [Desulfomicrobium sp.]
MFKSLRHLSWVFSIALHLVVLVGGAYVSTGTHIKLNLNKRMYEVDLVGPPNKGKPGAKSAPAAAGKAVQKPAPKDAKTVKAPDEPKKPEKKAVPSETAKAIPLDSANATKVAEAKPEEPKKPEPKKEAPKKEEPKKEETKKEAAKKEESKAEKKPSKEDILAEALGEATKTAASTKGSQGAAKSGSKGGSKDALADALADLGREVSGRGTRGDGTAEDGDGEGVSSGSLDQYYATQVVRAIRQNWRFPRLSNIVLATTVELTVNKAGEILGSRMVNGSGRSDFDASVMRAIEDTKKLPPLPETLDATLVITFYNTENG